MSIKKERKWCNQTGGGAKSAKGCFLEAIGLLFVLEEESMILLAVQTIKYMIQADMGRTTGGGVENAKDYSTLDTRPQDIALLEEDTTTLAVGCTS